MSKVINAERTKLVALTTLQLERKLRAHFRAWKHIDEFIQTHSVLDFDDGDLFHTKIVIDVAESATTLFTSAVRNVACELD